MFLISWVDMEPGLPPISRPEDLNPVTQPWDDFYSGSDAQSLSWYESVPETLKDIVATSTPKQSVIDVGGGASTLAGHLQRLGYSDITVVDLSPIALEAGAENCDGLGAEVKWVAADITDFEPGRKYDLWHDRAMFHFLTEPTQRHSYRQAISRLVADGGSVIIGVFAENGPRKCAGQPVCNYSQDQLVAEFSGLLEPLTCRTHEPSAGETDRRPYTICRFTNRKGSLHRV